MLFEIGREQSAFVHCSGLVVSDDTSHLFSLGFDLRRTTFIWSRVSCANRILDRRV
jgi:hypothetical protein